MSATENTGNLVGATALGGRLVVVRHKGGDQYEICVGGDQVPMSAARIRKYLEENP